MFKLYVDDLVLSFLMIIPNCSLLNKYNPNLLIVMGFYCSKFYEDVKLDKSIKII